MIYNDFLKKSRLSNGLSAIDAAATLSVSPQYLSRIENGHQQPSEALTLKMVELYSLAPEDASLLMQTLGYTVTEGNSADYFNIGTDESQVATPSMIKINAETTPVHYTNALYCSSDEFGIVLDAGQKVGPTNEIQIVSRIGMSYEHAQRLAEVLQQHIKNARDRGIQN